jgi:hypothetical protein
VRAPRFDAWFRTLPVILRRRARLQSWALRLRMAVPAFFAVVIPATILSVVSAMAFKWIPGSFNYAYAQVTASAVMSLFHAATAAILIGGSSAFGLTLYRMVFGREHVRCGYLRPFGAVIAGALFGTVGGMLCSLGVAGVFTNESLQALGWVDLAEPAKPPLFKLCADLFVHNRCGLVFTLSGAGAGVGMAMITNRLRALPEWENFLEVQAATSLRSLHQVWEVIRKITVMALPYAWPLPAAVGLASLLAIVALHSTGNMRPSELPWNEAFGGGLVFVERPNRQPGQELTPIENATIDADILNVTKFRKEAADAKAKAEGRALTDQEKESLELTEDEKAAIKQSALRKLDDENAKRTQRDTLRTWKTSRCGRIMGIAGDSMTEVIGAFFTVVGMSFGIVILRSGINIEPTRPMV